MTGRELVERALYLSMYGESITDDTWRSWEHDAEVWLRGGIDYQEIE